MKYIVEVLSNGNEPFPSLDDTRAALDSYQYHRPGQPIVALYYDEDDSTKALIAVGTSTSSYYIIGTIDENTLNDQIITNISASNVWVDPIDITNLLSAEGAGNSQWGGDIQPLDNYVRRHFGYLGTTSSSWAVEGSNGSYSTLPMTVQQLFEAILNGEEITDRDTVVPNVRIAISAGGPNFFDEFALNIEDGTSQTITIRVQCDNIEQVPSDTTFTTTNIPSGYVSYNAFLNAPNHTITIPDVIVNYPPIYTVFSITGSNEGGNHSSSAVVCWVNEEDPTPDPIYEVFTDSNWTFDYNGDIDATYITFPGSCNWNAIYNSSNRGIILNGDTNNPIPYTWSTDLNAWCVKINAGAHNLEFDTTYTYQAYAVDPNGGTHYGSEVSFSLTIGSDRGWEFRFGVEPSGAGTCVAYVDDSQAISGSEYPNGSTWSFETFGSSDSSNGYEFDYIEYLHNTIRENIYDRTIIGGTLTSPIEVYAHYRQKTNPPYEAGQWSIRYQVFLGNSDEPIHGQDVSDYLICNVPWYLVYTGNDYRVTCEERQGYSIAEFSLISGDCGFYPYVQDKYVDLTNISSDIVIGIRLSVVLPYTVNLFATPPNAINSFTINGVSVPNDPNITLYPSDPAPVLSFNMIPTYVFDGWFIGNQFETSDNPYTYNLAVSNYVEARFHNDPTNPGILKVSFPGSDSTAWRSCSPAIAYTKSTTYTKYNQSSTPWADEQATSVSGYDFDYYIPCIESSSNSLHTTIKLPVNTEIDTVYASDNGYWVPMSDYPFTPIENTQYEYVFNPGTDVLEETAILAIILRPTQPVSE